MDRTRLIRWFSGLDTDVRFAARLLTRSPGFAVAAIATLALGLGANAAVFSLLNQFLLQYPADVASPGRLRRVWTEQPAAASMPPYVSDQLSYHAFMAVRSAIADQCDLALYALRPRLEIGRDADVTVPGEYVTANYFPLLGVRPEIGRSFTEAETDPRSSQRVAVVGNAFWHSYLGAARDVIGRPLAVDGQEYRIIGVAPAGFAGVDLQKVELWLPLGTFPTRETARVPFWDSSVITFSTLGRLHNGANETAAENRATYAYRGAPVTDFAPSQRARVFLRSILEARGPRSQPIELSVAVRLQGVAFVILLITTANVINLLLARATVRRREAAIRLAMGVTLIRLARLFVIEATLLALLAAGAALICAQVTGGVLRGFVLPGIQFARGPLDGVVVGATLALSLVVGVIAGIVPAFRVARTDLAHTIKDDVFIAGGAIRLPSLLVGVQVAFSVVLLVGAALFVASLRNVRGLRIGYDAPRLAFASIVLPGGERADTLSFAVKMRSVGGRVARLRGAEAVAFAREEPMSGFGRVVLYAAGDSSDSPNRPLPTASYVSGDFFKAAGLHFLAGVAFADDAGTSATSVVINQALERAYWRRGATGQCLHLQDRNSPCLIVTGVVEDAIRERPNEEPAPQVYLPLFASVRGQRPPAVMVIRSDPTEISAVLPQVSRLLRDEFPRGEPVIVRMEDRLAPQYRPWRLGAVLFSAFGGLALIVAALGVFGSVSYFVTHRTRELGIRIALGATSNAVLRHIVLQGIRPVAGGGVAGALLAILGGRSVGSLLYGISATNAVVIGAAVGTLSVVGAVAAAVPAIRATRIDPVRVITRQ